MSSDPNTRNAIGQGADAASAEAREIDLVLSASADPRPPADAVDNLLAVVGNMPQEQPEVASGGWSNPFGVGRFAAASTLAASLIIGIYAGTLGTLDPVIADFDPVFTIDDDGFSDPFDLNGLLQDLNGETG